ncbi:MAG TPA: flagellar basal body rod protein FlgC [Alphaproteobacteria bacterium]|nr:flagellar basal body rod protein FlgC [Alphaproteobacteria bacterium]
MDFSKIMQISASGMNAQSVRLRTIAENIANSESTSTTAGGDPYRRKLVTFKDVFDKSVGVNEVKIDKVTTDNSQLEKRHDPQNPGADKDGYVLMPNVNPLIEMMDMRQAQRSYEANLSVIDVTRSMASNTVNLLKG